MNNNYEIMKEIVSWYGDEYLLRLYDNTKNYSKNPDIALARMAIKNELQSRGLIEK